MRYFTTIVLLAIMFIQTFSSILIRAEYLLNKSYISRVLCINRDEPQMKCHGKCYLSKKLKENEKQEPAMKKEDFGVQPFLLPVAARFFNPVLLPVKQYFYTDKSFSPGFLHAIFHPPTV